MNNATESISNTIDVTDHHHHQMNHNNHGSLSSEVAVVVPTTTEFVEMKSNLPLRIENSPTTTTTTQQDNINTDDNNDINKNLSKKSNWVKFDDDYDNDNNGNSISIATNTTNVTNGNNNKTTAITATIATTATTPSTLTTIKKGIPVIPGPPVQLNKSISKTSSEITPAPAVLSHINLNSVTTSPQSTTTTVSTTRNETPKSTASATAPNPSGAPMRTIELSTGRIREGFANGDVIVTLLPTNTRWPWVTPAIFRPELVPEELMAQGLTLTVEEYVHAMETLVNDYRFTVYNICYKRVLVCWILFAFCVLLTLLFSGLKGIALFSLGVGWLFLNAAAIFFCMWIKLRLSRGLEKCLARVNKQLIRHKIILVLDDRGRISCHKVNLCFLYFDPAQCIAYLNEYIERNEQNGTNIQAGWEAKLDVDVTDIVIQGNNPVRLSRKQAIATEIFLSYLQRWGKDFLRRRLDWTVNEAGIHETPRHLMSSICPCQYTEEILNNKIKTQNNRSCCVEYFQNSCRNFC